MLRSSGSTPGELSFVRVECQPVFSFVRAEREELFQIFLSSRVLNLISDYIRCRVIHKTSRTLKSYHSLYIILVLINNRPPPFDLFPVVLSQ